MPAYTQPCPGRRCGVDFHDPASPAGVHCRQIGESQRTGAGSFNLASSAFNPMAEGPTMRAEDISVYGPNIARYTWVDDEEDAPGPGDVVSLSSYAGMTPSALHRDGVEYLGLRQTSWGDQVGDAITRSNHRALLRDYPDTFVQMESMDSNELVLRSDQEIPQALGEILSGLQEYPLYDEDDHEQLRQELLEESWDAYASADLRSSLGSIYESQNAETDPDSFDDVKLRRVLNEVLAERESMGVDTFHAEGADNVSFNDFEDIAANVAAKIKERGADSMGSWDVDQPVHVVTDEDSTGFSTRFNRELADGSYAQLTRDFYPVQEDSGSWTVHEQRTSRTFEDEQRLKDDDSSFTDVTQRPTGISGYADQAGAEQAANMAAIRAQMFGNQDIDWDGREFRKSN